MRSLTLKLGLAFIIVSITGAVVAAIFVRVATQQGFTNVFFQQAKTNFVNHVADYYQEHNTWDGVRDFLQHQDPQAPPAQGDQHPSPFVLVDQQGMVRVPGQDYPFQSIVSSSQLAKGTPVTVSGQRVGTVLVDGNPPPLSPQDQALLASTQQALLLGTLAAFLIALVLGLFLARSLTRPVRELTTALQAMATGELEQAVPVRSKDELGDLSVAFNQMSTDLAFANQQRRQMTADIAHDLRTPVTVIAGYLEALRDGVLPPTPERFAILYDEAQHLQGLIEDLRTLSLADAGELALRRQPIAPATLLQRIAALYEHQAEQQGIALRVDASDTLPTLNVDADRMTQVLSNLVSNAMRYTPNGGSITISAGRQGNDVALRVQDTGQGIAPDALPRIFDRFYRADSARAQSGGESGLGLAIARAIVEAHGGTISASSTMGNGATFIIHLPLG